MEEDFKKLIQQWQDTLIDNMWFSVAAQQLHSKYHETSH